MAAVLLAGAAPAFAKSFVVDSSDVTLELESDGSVMVTEEIEFNFSGSFQGAYRDIPLRGGEAITNIEVLENGVAYAPGAPTALGSSGAPSTYGVENRGNAARIVWHYRATDEVRTFTIKYRMLGLAVAYDDVVDVNFKVWGDEWDVGVDRVTSRLTYPGTATAGEILVYGHPSQVDGATSLGTDGVSPSLEAVNVPARTFVEMRVVLPRSVLTQTNGAQVVAGPGLDEILRRGSR